MSRPPFFIRHPESHYMKAGAIAFVPGWIVLFMITLTLSIFAPSLFPGSDFDNSYPIRTTLFFFIIGSLMPAFDDLFAFVFGPPFAHHSLFHSFLGAAITYIIFFLIGESVVANYAVLGNLFHIFFNFYLDYVTIFFPVTYKEFGLTDFVKITTYGLKVIHYPIIFLVFTLAVLKVLL